MLVVLALLAVRALVGGGERAVPEGTVGDEQAVLEAFRGERSGFMVEVEGVVERELADDDEGSRHQLFTIRLSSGHTLLVSHNIDLADRVPIDRGDLVRVRGQYEWNDRGGVLHWTHRDPAGRREGGWIQVGDARIR